VKNRISASFATMLLLGVFAASNVTAAVPPNPVEVFAGNYQCTSDDLKIDPVAGGTYNLVGGGTITITVRSTAAGPVFDFTTSGATIDSIVVKGGPNYHVYWFTPGVESAEGLHSPLNPNNGKWYGLSHLCIGSTKKAAPDPDPKK
jgi:hypothetical protein